VKFSCEDAGTSVKVELRVWDNSNMSVDENHNPIYGDVVDGIADNYNITWGWVKVEDPNPPVITVYDVTVACHYPYETLDYADLGEISVVGACDEIPYETDGPHWMTGDRLIDPHPSMFDFNFHGWESEYRGLYEDDGFAAFDYTCGYGFAWVKYTATGNKGTEAEHYQLIAVIYKDDFSCDNVDWPADRPEESCDPGPNEPLDWDAGPCELIGWSLESDTFNFESDACQKIVNHYTVIDWCVYDHAVTFHCYQDEMFNREPCIGCGGSSEEAQFPDLWYEYRYERVEDLYVTSCNPDPDNDNPHYSGVYEWVQVIKISDDTDPEIANEDDWMIAVDNAECDVKVTLTNSAMDAGCQGTWFKWGLFVDYDRDGYYDWEEDQRGLDVSFDVPDAEGNDYTSVAHYGMMTWDAKWKVWDGCGNVTLVDFEIMIVDKKPPTPYCVSLSSAVMNNGQVELWACDFNVGSFDNCYGEELSFTFNEIQWDPDYVDYYHYFDENGVVLNEDGSVAILEGKPLPKDGEYADQSVLDRYAEGARGGVQLWQPQGLNYPGDRLGCSAMIFNCDDIPEAEVKMSAWDGKDNTDFCIVTLSLIDNQGACGGAGSRAGISGTTATESGDNVSDVVVNLQNLTNPEFKVSVMTGNDGKYAFASNPMYNSYDITSVKNDEHDNGVSTLDLLLIQRHILGITSLTSPYNMVAADINSNGSITGADLVVLRKLILGIYNEFPTNNSWRFVDGSQTLTVDNALSDFNEVRNIADLDGPMVDQDFVAVKIGDVNGTVQANARDLNTGTRSNNVVNVELTEQNVKAGELVDLTFSAKEFTEVYGYQFTLELNGLTFEAVNEGSALMTDANIGIMNDNTLTVSYSDVNAITATNDLFTLTVRATESGKISNMLSLTSNALASEAYVGTGLDVTKVAMTINGQEVRAFSLGQNTPNPFDDNTVIGFDLPESGNASLTVYNVAGKVIKAVQGQFAQGYNEIKLTKTDINTTGVLYYTLKSGDHTATKKMIIIE
jgi:hypothetical protein